MLQDRILETLKQEEANQAHKITVIRQVSITRQVPESRIEKTTVTNEDGSTTETSKVLTDMKDQVFLEDQEFQEDAPPFFAEPLDQIAQTIAGAILQLIKTEIKKPEYQNLTNAETLEAFNKNALTIFEGIAYAPNAITLDELLEAGNL